MTEALVEVEAPYELLQAIPETDEDRQAALMAASEAMKANQDLSSYDQRRIRAVATVNMDSLLDGKIVEGALAQAQKRLAALATAA